MSDAPKPADALVVFGITGDLARKMTLRSLYRLERRGLLDCPVIGVAVEKWSDERLREHALECVRAAGETVSDSVWRRFASRLSYVSGDFNDRGTYRRLARALGERSNPVFYLEIPPSLFGLVVSGLGEAGLRRSSRRVREAVRKRPALGARADRGASPPPGRVPDLQDRPLPGQ